MPWKGVRTYNLWCSNQRAGRDAWIAQALGSRYNATVLLFMSRGRNMCLPVNDF